MKSNGWLGNGGRGGREEKNYIINEKLRYMFKLHAIMGPRELINITPNPRGGGLIRSRKMAINLENKFTKKSC
jgi:hypothetical protein